MIGVALPLSSHFLKVFIYFLPNPCKFCISYVTTVAEAFYVELLTWSFYYSSNPTRHNYSYTVLVASNQAPPFEHHHYQFQPVVCY